MTRQHLLTLMVLLAVLATAGCAALRPREPVTPLRWTLDAHTPAHLGWGDVRRVEASEALQSDRLLVARGAELMQHAQYRWYARPAQMVDERLRWQGGGEAVPPTLDGAVVELWLHAFELVVDVSGRAAARVAMSATLRCADRGSAGSKPLALGAAEHVVPLGDQAARSLAGGFADASDAVLAELAGRARAQRMRCAASPAGDEDDDGE